MLRLIRRNHHFLENSGAKQNVHSDWVWVVFLFGAMELGDACWLDGRWIRNRGIQYFTKMEQMVKPLFSTVPLVVRGFIRAVLPLFLYLLEFIHICLGNKGEEVCCIGY